MSFYGSSVEYGLHCLLHLVEPFEQGQPSSRELAEFQGISPSYVAKLFTRLEKAGLVASTEGVGGGFRLARSPERITVLDVVDALEENKPWFECRNIRDKCVLCGNELPHPALARWRSGIGRGWSWRGRSSGPLKEGVGLDRRAGWSSGG